MESNGDDTDWVELLNTGTTAIDLGGPESPALPRTPGQPGAQQPGAAAPVAGVSPAPGGPRASGALAWTGDDPRLGLTAGAALLLAGLGAVALRRRRRA